MAKIITKDVYEIVTNAIVEKLERGVIPWRQPWRGAGMPRNYVTKRPYRGLNLLLLGTLDYPSRDFLTFRQVQELGGRVNRGEKAHLVILWLWLDDRKAAEESAEASPRRRPMLRYYHVFNLAQCIGIRVPKEEARFENDLITRCEDVIREMPNAPRIVHEGSEACYYPEEDLIHMPRMEMFERSEGYYSTLFHELVHSTGHQSRLGRKELMAMSRFGTRTYSIEELTAEIGASYLCAHAGIGSSSMENSAAYIKGWLDVLNGDRKFVVYASAHAQRAADYVLNVMQEEGELADALIAEP